MKTVLMALGVVFLLFCGELIYAYASGQDGSIGRLTFSIAVVALYYGLRPTHTGESP